MIENWVTSIESLRSTDVRRSSSQWWRKRLWFPVKGKESNGRFAGIPLCYKRRRMVREDTERCVTEESDPVDDETDEDEDNNNNESSKGSSNADAFSALETAMECTPPACDDFQYSNSVWFHILHELHSVFGYPNNRVFERSPVPIDSDQRRSAL
ncbi:hypothetical protein TNCV_2468491, partial [Trichonephila clavipes]